MIPCESREKWSVTQAESGRAEDGRGGGKTIVKRSEQRKHMTVRALESFFAHQLQLERSLASLVHNTSATLYIYVVKGIYSAANHVPADVCARGPASGAPV